MGVIDSRNTKWTIYTMIIGATTTAPTKSTTPNIDVAKWRKNGPIMEIEYVYRAPNVTGAAAGSGTYLFPLPAGYSIDTSFVTVDGGSGFFNLQGNASVGFIIGATNVPSDVIAYNTTNIAIYAGGAYVGSGSYAMNNANIPHYSFIARIPILGWS